MTQYQNTAPVGTSLKFYMQLQLSHSIQRNSLRSSDRWDVRSLGPWTKTTSCSHATTIHNPYIAGQKPLAIYHASEMIMFKHRSENSNRYMRIAVCPMKHIRSKRFWNRRKQTQKQRNEQKMTNSVIYYYYYNCQTVKQFAFTSPTCCQLVLCLW